MEIILKTLSDYHTILESIYFLSGLILSIVAIYGLQQIRIMKLDLRLRQERAAKEKAIEYCTRFISIYCPLSDKYFDEMEKYHLEIYNDKIGDFSGKSIPTDWRPNLLKRFKVYLWLPSVNELQAISSAFVTGVADEKTGFSIIGRSYCASVECNYDLISYSRGDKTNPVYQSIVDLYLTWSPRLTKHELEQEREIVEQKILKIKENKLKPLS